MSLTVNRLCRTVFAIAVEGDLLPRKDYGVTLNSVIIINEIGKPIRVDTDD